MPHTDQFLTPEEINQISLHPYFSKIRHSLIQTLVESRKILTPTNLLALQLGMAEQIKKLEEQITLLSKTARREPQNEEWLSREIYKTHRRIFKNIADGIAWRYLKCLRAPLRLISNHANTGNLSQDFNKEVEEATRIVNSTGSFVLINDITNVLRYGDLTILDGDKISFYEVKAGKKNGRAIKQRNKLDSVLNMLNAGEHTIGNQTAKVHLVESVPTNFSVEISKTIKEALRNETGLSHTRPSPYLWFRCVSITRMVEYRKKYGSLPFIPDNPFKKGKFTRPFTNQLIFDIYSPNIAPYSIFPFSEEVIIDLLIGSIRIKACLDEEELAKSFSGKGWILTYPSSEIRQEWLDTEGHKERNDAVRNGKYQASLSKGSFTTNLSWDMIYRIGFEFLSVKAIVETAETAKDNMIPRTGDFIITEFLGERNRWL